MNNAERTRVKTLNAEIMKLENDKENISPIIITKPALEQTVVEQPIVTEVKTAVGVDGKEHLDLPVIHDFFAIDKEKENKPQKFEGQARTLADTPITPIPTPKTEIEILKPEGQK
jgi:hypothetical protein